MEVLRGAPLKIRHRGSSWHIKKDCIVACVLYDKLRHDGFLRTTPSDET